MPEINRTRDVEILVKGDAYPVLISDTLKAQGWQGGQAVRWADSPRNEFLVTRSDGPYGGFLLWGSNESSDVYTSMTGQQVEYGYGILCSGGWVISTRTYEQYSYASRQAGPLVPLTYTVGERLRFSLRGLWTREDEWTLAGDPRAPNDFFIATVVQAPVLNKRGVPYLMVQTAI